MQNLAKKFRRGAKMLILGASLMGLAGCATTGGIKQNNTDYKFLDSYNGYRVIERDSDIYLERLDGSESRRITNTPDVKESFATISKDGNYIAYNEVCGNEWEHQNHKYYIIKKENDDNSRKQISFEEMRKLNIERERYKE